MEAGVRTHTIETCGGFRRSRGMVRNEVVESVRVFSVERRWEKREAGSVGYVVATDVHDEPSTGSIAFDQGGAAQVSQRGLSLRGIRLYRSSKSSEWLGSFGWGSVE
jgi:hypothetical protein